MNIVERLNELKRLSPDKQIEQIKKLKKDVTDRDIVKLRSLVESISPPWFKNAIQQIIIDRTLPEPIKRKEEPIEDDVAYNIEEIKSIAVAESIGHIIHELDPIIGSLDLAARREVNDFDNSTLKGEIERLFELMDSFVGWQKAEQSPNYKDVNIYRLVLEEVDRVKDHANVEFIFNISQSLNFELDNSLTRFIVSNALRNAIESVDSVTGREIKPIIINAGVTDTFFWMSLIDDGIGLPAEQSIIFQSRYTTKPGNRGFGLSIVSKAIKSMKGDWKLQNSTLSGAEFYFEIPQRKS